MEFPTFLGTLISMLAKFPYFREDGECVGLQISIMFKDPRKSGKGVVQYFQECGKLVQTRFPTFPGFHMNTMNIISTFARITENVGDLEVHAISFLPDINSKFPPLI